MENFKTIVCVGDSTTSQEWCHPNWFDWLDFSLRQKDEVNGWKNKMINSGKDGGTIPFFNENFDFMIGRFFPGVVLLSLGFNHLELTGDTEKNLVDLVIRIKKIGSEVVLWSTYKTIKEDLSGKLEEIRNVYKRVAKETNSQFVDIFEEFSKYDLSNIFTFRYPWNNEVWNLKKGEADFLHCNLVGNQIIAEKLAKDIFGIELEDWNNFGTMKRVDLKDYLLKDTVTS